jgi:hypothetical protein
MRLMSSTGEVPPTATKIDIGWRVQLHSMTGPRAAELNGALARVFNEKRRLLLYVPVDKAYQPWVSDDEGRVIDRWAVELESGQNSKVFVKPANLAAVCAHVPCRRLLYAPKICSKCKVARVSACPQFCTRFRVFFCHTPVV